MLFNSFEFFIYFPVVVILFFLLPHKYRWFHLLAASCYFYMAFVPIYILVLFASIVVNYFAGGAIEKSNGLRRKRYTIAAIVINLLILCVFKYYNFFVDNANYVIHAVDNRAFSLPVLNLILPLGLSFHTFQAISYLIEVNRGNVKAEKHFGIYALYIMFFPQLVAGPIERPQNMLHQFHEKKKVDSTRIIIGLKIMLWGFFKKLVVADRLALYVNDVYSNVDSYESIHLWLAVFVFFPFQVYCDFSGYSSIAIGGAKVLGYDLMENFKRPFSSLTTSELWNRWHISLSSWFRDYLYQPLVILYRDYGKWSVVIGLLVTFFLSGLWHGAGWNFIVYGLVQGSVMVVEFWLGIKAVKLSKTAWGRFRGLLTTYFFFSLSLIFFRSVRLSQSGQVLKKLFWNLRWDISRYPIYPISSYVLSFTGIVTVLYFEKYYADKILYQPLRMGREVAWSSFLAVTIILLGVFHDISFIYFQF